MIPFFRRMKCLHPAVGAVRRSSRYRPAPLLTASPVRALIDDPVCIGGKFLPPHWPVTVRALMHSDGGDLWESFAHYNTDAEGTINLARDHSLGGLYFGCEPMGLFWGMQPVPGEKEGLRLRKENVETPYIVHISLMDGHVTPSESQSNELAATIVERWYMAPGVKRIIIRENGIIGTLFLPSGPGPFPAMLDLWGMGGGLTEYRAALLASRGYASFALAYFKHEGLPGPRDRINVGDAYFKSAFQLLQNHQQVCPERVGIIGLSFGVYLTLRLAIKSGLKPSCLICVNGGVGSNVRLRDADGRTDSFESDQRFWKFDNQGYVILKDTSLPVNFPPEHTLKLENIDCPLMYIESEDDLSCSATENANVVEETLRAAGKSHLYSRVTYPGAGHLLEPPYTPSARISLWSIKPKKLFAVWGGYPAPHAAAQENSWKRILGFLESNLRGGGEINSASGMKTTK
ncbi:peroxisomal succinyl-coenzyme A thioesterase-like [Thalassophryne amazonica]|uniref:peroxisomal succinyl-coenzyme A thioesterase-like n=1 Tax=Thalassophryne amazonica TaxID=390379 RepID=UPI001470A2C0|nr:peroxisomal succinyl-coenzyme A thioesterase-like [Thalassophryne amazonica]